MATSNEMGFVFQLDDIVIIDLNNKAATVIGRAEYSRSQPSYLVEYVDGRGDVASDWKLSAELRPQAARNSTAKKKPS